MELTPEQQHAVDCVVNAVVSGQKHCHFLTRSWMMSQPPTNASIQAVAGSGKSHTLAAIVERLVQERPNCRVLCLQFNQDVCARMRRRLASAVDTGHADIYTLHAFGIHILQSPVLDPEKAYKHWRRLRHESGTPHEWQCVRRYLDTVRHSGWLPPAQEPHPFTLERTILESMLRDRTSIDQEDAIYHCLYYNVRSTTEYDVVVLDEAQPDRHPRVRGVAVGPQDMNDANHAFLRHCVVPPAHRTVVCAVGDPAQAIYQFRGANPRSLSKFRDTFRATSLALTCCFRCPRRVVAVASHLNSQICAAPGAPCGTVRIRTCRSPWVTTLLTLVDESTGGSTLFTTRCNASLIDILVHLHTRAADHPVPRDTVRWAAPAVAAQLREVLQRCAGMTLGPGIPCRWFLFPGPPHGRHRHNQHRTRSVGSRCPSVDTDSHSTRNGGGVVTTGVAVHQPRYQESPFLQMALRTLNSSSEAAQLVLATIHGAKGSEYDHVVVHQYNLLGSDQRPDEQDRNMLYIAVTRALRSLTFLLTESTQHIPSPLLPLDLIHYAGEMWSSSI